MKAKYVCFAAALAGCSSIGIKSKQPPELRVHSIGAWSLTEKANLESSSFPTSHQNRRFLRERPWQWRYRNAIGAGPQSPQAPMMLGENEALVMTLGGGLMGWNLKAGSKLWDLEVPIGVASKPFVTNDAIYFAGMDAVLRKLDRVSKAQIWALKISSESLGGVIEKGGIVYVSTSDNALWAVDAKVGKSLWIYKRPAPESSVAWSLRGHARPLLNPAGTRVYAGFSDGVFASLDALSGQTIWERKFERFNSLFKDADTSPLMSDDGNEIYLSIVDGDFVALKSSDGSTLWSFKGGSHAEPLLVSKENVLYVPTSDSRLLKVGTRRGEILWLHEVAPKGLASKVHLLGDNMLVFATTHGALRILDQRSGRLLWEDDFGSGTVSWPMGNDKLFYVLNSRNVLMGYQVFRNLNKE